MARLASPVTAPAEAPVEYPPIFVRMLYGYFPHDPQNHPHLDQTNPKVKAGEEIELPYAEAKKLLREKRAERVEDVD